MILAHWGWANEIDPAWADHLVLTFTVLGTLGVAWLNRKKIIEIHERVNGKYTEQDALIKELQKELEDRKGDASASDQR